MNKKKNEKTPERVTLKLQINTKEKKKTNKGILSSHH